MNQSITIKELLSWFFMILFLMIGIMNMLLIHPVPGISYLMLSILYCLPLVKYLSEHKGLVIPFLIKIMAALLFLWVTLAVGDLAELLGL